MPADIAPSPITAMTLLFAAAQSRADRHAERGRDRGRGMRGAERIVFALGALGEAGKAAALAQRADAVAPAGQDLVRIGLMADVPDQAIARRVENIVQRHGQFDDAEPGAQMPAGDRDGADRFGAQFVGDGRRGDVEAAEVFGVRISSSISPPGNSRRRAGDLKSLRDRFTDRPAASASLGDVTRMASGQT